jgi:hypothetical protein
MTPWNLTLSVRANIWFAFEESGWSPPEKPEIVGLRVEFQETELQRRVKRVAGKWNSTKRIWEINCDQAVALGLNKRTALRAAADAER